MEAGASRPVVQRRSRFDCEELPGDGLVLREREDYLVPMVARAIDISERLHRLHRGLSVEDLHILTGYSKSSIYRILRTFAAFGYVARKHNGAYKLNGHARHTLGSKKVVRSSQSDA